MINMKILLKLSLLACFSLCYFNAVSQEQNVHIGFTYPLSTNGLSAKEYTNGFSFHALYGISGGEKAFILSGIGASVFGNAEGTQIAGVFNHITGDVKGFGIAGVANIFGNTSGGQFGGVANFSADMDGIQMAGLLNIAQKVNGFQFAGLGNFSENIEGFQFAGLINKAKNVDGVQFAGLLNIADNSDYPIGIINIIKNGEKNVGVQFDELQNLSAAFRSGGKYTYGILGVGYNLEHPNNTIVLEAGLGFHINYSGRFGIDAELIGTNIIDIDHSSKTAERSSFRVMPVFSILPNISVFAGPSINYLRADATLYKDLFPGWSFSQKTNSKGIREQWYLGYMAGLRYCF